MANMLNVDGSDDPSYRYKMPRLASKVEGRGNGVKTVLLNCSDIAKALSRSTQQVTKYFGCELGAMTNYDESADKALVNGSFETSVLQEALTGYIQRYVLCPSCHNPETVQELKGKKKNAIILLNCKACGACEDADNAHKLVTFIIKEMSGEGSSKNKKEERRKKKLERSKKKNGEGKSVDESVSDGEVKKKKKKKKDKDKDGEKKKKKKSKRRKEISSDEGKSHSDDENGVDEVAEGLGAMTVHDVAALQSCVEKVTGVISSGASDSDILTAVGEEQTNCGLRRADRIPILFFSLFNPTVGLTTLVQKFSLLGSLTNTVKDCFLSKESIEVELLLCLEEGVVRTEEGDKRASIRKIVPVVLKSLYDEDLVEEKTIIDWFEQKLDPVKYKHVRCVVSEDDVKLMKKEAEPIIEWLKEADTDTETDEED